MKWNNATYLKILATLITPIKGLFEIRLFY